MQAFRTVFCRHRNLSVVSEKSVYFRRLSSAVSMTDRTRQNLMLELCNQSPNWNVEPQDVLKTVQKCPELMKCTPSEWNSLFTNLVPIGFKGSEILQMMEKCPVLLKIDPKNLQAIWEALIIFKLSTIKLVPALVNKPYVFCSSPKDADDKALAIINFAGAKNNSLRVLTVCDNPFALSLEELKQVIHYVKEIMKVQRTHEICRSRVVECPLLKLKMRHTFLAQSGLFIPVDPDIPITIPHNNPRLSDIVNTEDEVFATQVAKLTYEEFAVFQELYEKQMREEMYSDDDDLDDI